MHRSVFRDAKYIKIADEHSVQVVTMLRLMQAIVAENARLRTFKGKDAWGEETDFLVEFPALTVEALQDVSLSAAANYLTGERLPQTSIVDPHTLEVLWTLGGLPESAELIRRIKARRISLTKKYGPGLSRKTWRAVLAGQIEIDKLLARDRIVEALKTWRGLETRAAKGPAALKEKLRISRDVILDDAGKRLDEVAKLFEAKKPGKARARLAQLPEALKGTRLEKRAAALSKK
jgi:hypothetical protein